MQNSLEIVFPILEYAAPKQLRRGLKETPSMKHIDRLRVQQYQ